MEHRPIITSVVGIDNAIKSFEEHSKWIESEVSANLLNLYEICLDGQCSSRRHRELTLYLNKLNEAIGSIKQAVGELAVAKEQIKLIGEIYGTEREIEES